MINITVNFRQIVDRISDKTGMTQKDIAQKIFDISDKNLSNKIKRNSIDVGKITRWAVNASVDLNWLLTGKGDPSLKIERATIWPIHGDSETNEFLEMTQEVLSSKTDYSVYLMSNIRSFHQAMKAEKRFKELEGRIARIKREKQFRHEEERIRHTDPPDEKEEIIKRRALSL